MPISYAGIDLLLEDAPSTSDALDLRTFLDRHFSLEDMRLWSRAQVFNNTRSYRTGALALPNYPAEPRFKLNTLYWPTGATRWAYIHCLATDVIRNAITEALSGSAEPRTLSIGDGIERQMDVEMYMLTPKPITSMDLPEDSTSENLWLLTFVDERWFWQFKTIGDLDLGEDASWQDLISAVSGKIGSSTVGASAVDASYQSPNLCLLAKEEANVAAVIDAIAGSIGRRFVRKTWGAQELMPFDASESSNNGETEVSDAKGLLAGNRESTWYLTAGEKLYDASGNNDVSEVSLIPSHVSVVFPEEVPSNPGSAYVVTKDASDYLDSLLVGATSDFTVTFRSTAVADNTEDGTTIDNQQDLDDLADVIARDFYQSVSERYDYSFAGIMKWELTAYDDAVEWSVGRRGTTGLLECQTRVRSIPYNLTQEELYHSSGDYEICDCQDSETSVRILGAKITRETSGDETTLTSHGTPTGGTFIVGVGSYWSDPIDYNASSGAIQTAIEGIVINSSGDTLGSTTSVTATGGALSSGITITLGTGQAVRVRYGKLTGGNFAGDASGKVPCSILDMDGQTDRSILAKMLSKNWVAGQDTIAVKNKGWQVSPGATMLYGVANEAIAAGDSGSVTVGGSGPFGDISWPFSEQVGVNTSADDIAEEDEIIAFALNGKWSINLKACPE